MMRSHLQGLLLAAAIAASAGSALAADDIRINATDVFPESLSAAKDGTVYIGSVKGVLFRAAPKSSVAEPWIEPTAANGILSILGVLVDEPSRTLWLCSAPMPFRVPPSVGTSSLMAFDLKTGAQKDNWPLPAPASACNDVTIAKDGTAYAADTPNGRIFTLKRGASALELFGADAKLRGIDGIVFGGDGTLYANIVSRGVLVRIDRGADGAMTGVTELVLSQPVGGPDGFRLIAGNRFLLAEGNTGKIDQVTITGDRAEIRVLKDGLTSPPGVTMARGAVYAVEGKINYLVDPKLKGQDPGPFFAWAIPLSPAP